MGNFLWLSQFNFAKVALAKFIGKMQKKSGIMKSGLVAMPLFLLDDLLTAKIVRDRSIVSSIKPKLSMY